VNLPTLFVVKPSAVFVHSDAWMAFPFGLALCGGGALAPCRPTELASCARWASGSTIGDSPRVEPTYIVASHSRDDPFLRFVHVVPFERHFLDSTTACHVLVLSFSLRSVVPSFFCFDSTWRSLLTVSGSRDLCVDFRRPHLESSGGASGFPPCI